MRDALLQKGFDELDNAILDALQEDGRLSVADLARKIHLSSPAVYQRIKRLERAGVIKGYVALVDRELAGYDLMCFIRVSLQPHSNAQLQNFQKAMEGLSEVLECYHTAGAYGLLLKVVVSDHRALDKFISEYLMSLQGVEKVDTSVVLNEMKSTTTLELK